MQTLLSLLQLMIVEKASHKLDVIVAAAWYCDLLEACKAQAFLGYLKTVWEFSAGT